MTAIAGDDASLVSHMLFASGPYLVPRVRLTKSDDDVTAAVFRLHLFGADPYAAVVAGDTGDNGPMKLASASITDYLGSFDLDMSSGVDIYSTAGNTAIGVPLEGPYVVVPQIAKAGPFGLLEARGTYTPASGETFTVILETLTGS